MGAPSEKNGPPSTFGPKLRQERQRHHLSQEKLAEMVGCDVRSIRRWEQGKSIPDYENRHHLSKALDITLEGLHQLLQPVEEKDEESLEDEAVDITLKDFHQLLPLLERRDDKLIESDGAEILPNGHHSISIGSEGSSKYSIEQPQRRTLLKWGGAGLVATLAGGGLFYWFTRSSLPVSSAMPSSLSLSDPLSSAQKTPLSKIYTFNASNGAGICAVEWSPQHNFIVWVDREKIAQIITVTSNTNSPSQPDLGNTNSRTPTIPDYSYSPTKIGTAVNCVTWSPDGNQLASPNITNNTIHIWNPQNEADTHFTYTSGVPESIAWSNDGQHIAACGAGGMVGIWDIKGRHWRMYPGHTGTVLRVVWSSDSTYLASAGQDGTVRIWNTTREEAPIIYTGHRKAVFDVKWSRPLGTRIVSASEDKTVHIWNPMTGDKIYAYTQHTKSVQTAEWSFDGQYIASAGVDARIRIWDALTGKDYAIYPDHTNTIWALSWAPYGLDLASASEDGTMRIRYVNIQR